MSKVYLIMGVSGVGKTTIGRLLAQKMDLPFYDADDFHPEANRNKMAAGLALQDEDRWPWLNALANQIEQWSQEGAVLACSALKESYRETLNKNARVSFIFLQASFDNIKERLATRKNHFFSPELLQSQFDTLEVPKKAILVNAHKNPKEIVKEIQKTITQKSEIGLIGLGVMGKSLARNFAKNGIKMSVYNRHLAGKEEHIATQFVKEHTELNRSAGFDNLERFVASLALPRKIFIMVNAGPAVDAVIQELLPYLSKGDVLMDGGNSHYKDTQNRFDALTKKGIHFLGVGVSGGEKGALEGPSIMPGGSAGGYQLVKKYLERIAAHDGVGNPCCTRVGNGGSGHFVKMIHNGIEYAEMQLIAEVYDVMKTSLSMDNESIATTFKEWCQGDLDSYLLEISGKILSKKEKGDYVIDTILDKAKQKGTGGWSTTAALEIGAPLDTIAQSVMARIISGYKEERTIAQNLYTFSTWSKEVSRKQTNSIPLDTIMIAYKTARIINHGIGIEALRRASQEYDWGLNLAEITRIWTNGCIIRSVFMEGLEAVLLKDDETSIFLNAVISNEIEAGIDSLISFTSQTMQAYIATPVFSAATNYMLGYTRGDSVANMIQAQRDYFGAHTYERKDKAGNFHTQWED